ncbi:hypothetical protein SARC_07194 [Sphaeroforma arctica JP610]|uniref:Uncharacterized protein n=1 Tax=Sphaeroforma arctica JP610 TaxID=667725 RepID=A0A0L0FWV8_9EUKA|nr:hypothetical protein SARC_07194 [Sphaeroforma arctica JP610]KNC80443.1 hypothetical protein SARC_07194 [Sphaeroforma arctica JP610]|eukprot:XP_014154345.1 hypothetical protein SARC_07194 [Sphaeroforma arctica JP610]
MEQNDASFIDSLVQCIDLDGHVRGAPSIHDKNSPGKDAGHRLQRRNFSYDQIQIAANDPISATQCTQEQLPVIENDEPARNVGESLKSLPRNTSVNSWTRCEISSAIAESRSGFNFQGVASEVSRGT